MLSVPLPFLAGLIFALSLFHSLKGVEAAGSRRYFIAFLVLYALQGMIVGLHFGYGVNALALFQPVTAAGMPPLAYLAFRAMTGEVIANPWRHLAAPLCMLVAALCLPVLIDPLLFVTFVGYGLKLLAFTRTGGPDVMAEASLQRMRPALAAARLTAFLILFFAAADLFIAVYAAFDGRENIPRIVAVTNVVAIAVVVAYYLMSSRRAAVAPSHTLQQQPSEDDGRILARVSSALDENALFRNENLSLALLSRRSGLTAREVSGAVNRVTGLNVSQFVNNRRIAEACRLLEETKAGVTAVQLECGFSTKSNFNREFRRVTGMSPSRYRAAQRQTRQDDASAKKRVDLAAAKKQL
ncbi:MAG: AraC family transcriptional regulator [Neorhizobium sp.]|nr:AraC family transcriptional regulator [Neorhizobium sp.]